MIRCEADVKKYCEWLSGLYDAQRQFPEDASLERLITGLEEDLEEWLVYRNRCHLV